MAKKHKKKYSLDGSACIFDMGLIQNDEAISNFLDANKQHIEDSQLNSWDKISIPNTESISQIKSYFSIEDPKILMESDKMSVMSNNPIQSLSLGKNQSVAMDDSINADQLEKKLGHLVRYDALMDIWYIFNGSYWDGKCTEKKIIGLAEGVFVQRKRTLEAEKLDAKGSCNFYNLIASLNLLKCRAGIQQDQFDMVKHELTVKNGIVDLVTGRINDFEAERYHTLYVDTAFKRKAFANSLFESFLESICERDYNLIDWLQKVFGYAITGEIREQKMFILYGTGANGKTTLNEALTSVVKPLVKHLPLSVLTDPRAQSNSASPYLASAYNARIILASETRKREALNESMLKQLTSSAPISARPLYGKPIEYLPQFKIFLDTNQLPKINGDDYAIRRRLYIIPFMRTFNKNEIDHELPEKLQSQQEKEAILAWLIEGAVRYYQEGLELGLPDVVRQITEEYLNSETTIQPFIETCLVSFQGSECSATKLYAAYCDYCQQCGQVPENQTNFGSEITKYGIKKGRKSSGVVYLNIEIRQ